MKKAMAVLFVLLGLISALSISSALADRIPEEHNSRYIGAMKVVRCKEYVTLRAEPYKWTKALAKVPKDVELKGFYGVKVKDYTYEGE